MELREKMIAAIKAHYGLSNPDDVAYKLANPEGLADAIFDIPEIARGQMLLKRENGLGGVPLGDMKAPGR